VGLKLDCPGGCSGGQSFSAIHQVLIYRILSQPLGGRGARRLHIWTAFQKPGVAENRGCLTMSALPPKADIDSVFCDVRFVP
jgi:hypothetical protein